MPLSHRLDGGICPAAEAGWVEHRPGIRKFFAANCRGNAAFWHWRNPENVRGAGRPQEGTAKADRGASIQSSTGKVAEQAGTSEHGI